MKITESVMQDLVDSTDGDDIVVVVPTGDMRRQVEQAIGDALEVIVDLESPPDTVYVMDRSVYDEYHQGVNDGRD